MKTLTETIITQQLLNKIRAFKKLELLVTREIIADILIYLDSYTELHPDHVFALKSDIIQIINEKMEDLNNDWD